MNWALAFKTAGRGPTAEHVKGSHYRTSIKGPATRVKGLGSRGKGPSRGSGGPFMVSCIRALKVLVMPLEQGAPISKNM